MSRKVKVHLIGPNGAHDVLWKRLQSFPDMAVRPTVVLNHLRVRLAVASVPYYCDHILAAHAPDALPSFAELNAQCEGLLCELREKRVNDHNVSVERAQKKATGDVSGTRDGGPEDSDALQEARRAHDEVTADEPDHTEAHEHEGVVLHPCRMRAGGNFAPLRHRVRSCCANVTYLLSHLPLARTRPSLARLATLARPVTLASFSNPNTLTYNRLH